MNARLQHLPPAESRLAIFGVARNCAATIRADVQRIAAAAINFKGFLALVVESDSDDETPAVLRSLKLEWPWFSYVSLGALRDTIPSRTDRIAHCRNICLDAFRDDPRFRQCDYAVMADMDGINTRLSARGFMSCWDFHGWDVCTANQKGPYYDLWTLRHSAWCNGDCWEEAEALTPVLGRDQALQLAVYSRMVHLPTSMPPVRVRSAFGGFAVYSGEAYRHGARYAGTRSDGSPVSDHVALNEALDSAGFRIFINPAMVNAGMTPHTVHVGVLPTLRRYMRLRFGVSFQNVRKSLRRTSANVSSRSS
jgi:hypothetical protein